MESATSIANLNAAGLVLSSFGAANSIIGSYLEADATRYELKSQELAAEFQESTARINARDAEREAQDLMRAGHQEYASLTLSQRDRRATTKTVLAASGVALGVGNAAEIMASLKVVDAIDKRTLEENTQQRVNAARIQGANYTGAAALARANASSLRVSRRSINPASAAFNSALSGAGYVADRWARAKYYSR